MLAYRWPLANYTGGAEVLYGNNNGKVGCTVVTGPKPPLVPYYGMYFDGSVSSYVEIGMGTEKNLSDWAFVVFLFLYDLTGGTILHYKYDGPTVLSPSYSDEIRIWLNGSHIMLIIRGPSGEDFGTVAVQHGFIVGQRTWLMFSHGYNDGRIIIRSLDSVLYDSYTATNFVYIHQPAKIKLAGSYGYEALPFKGSIVCLGVYDLTMTYDDIKMSLYSCDPRYWNTIPASIGKCIPNKECVWRGFAVYINAGTRDVRACVKHFLDFCDVNISDDSLVSVKSITAISVVTQFCRG